MVPNAPKCSKILQNAPKCKTVALFVVLASFNPASPSSIKCGPQTWNLAQTLHGLEFWVNKFTQQNSENYGPCCDKKLMLLNNVDAHFPAVSQIYTLHFLI